LIKVPLSKKILFDHIENGSTITVDWVDEKVVFNVVHPVLELLENKTVDENGIIVI
jgi:hypothetical protein